MSRSNRNCCTAAKLSNRDPGAGRGGVEDVVDVGDVAAHLDVHARVPQHRAATSPQTNVAAWPRCVVSYGVIPQTYTRARPTTGTGRPSSRSTVSAPGGSRGGRPAAAA